MFMREFMESTVEAEEQPIFTIAMIITNAIGLGIQFKRYGY